MNEKAGLAASQDYGKDEKSCQKLLAKHNALITDVESYGTVIEELATEGRRLIQNKHFDSLAIETRQVQYYTPKMHKLQHCNRLITTSRYNDAFACKNTRVTNVQHICENAYSTTCQQDVFTLFPPSALTRLLTAC